MADGKTSNVELDEVLRPLTDKSVLVFPCNATLTWSKGNAEQVESFLLSQPAAPKRCYLPLWFRNHWLAGIITGVNGTCQMEVYDSAPSPMVRRDLENLFRRSWPTLQIEYGSCAQQRRDSNDCGLYMVATFYAHALGVTIAYPTTVPKRLRELFVRHWTIKDVATTLSQVTNGGAADKPVDNVVSLVGKWLAETHGHIWVEATWSETLTPCIRSGEIHTWIGQVLRPATRRSPLRVCWRYVRRGNEIHELTDDEGTATTCTEVLPGTCTFWALSQREMPNVEDITERRARARAGITALIRTPVAEETSAATSDTDSDSEGDPQDTEPLFTAPPAAPPGGASARERHQEHGATANNRATGMGRSSAYTSDTRSTPQGTTKIDNTFAPQPERASFNSHREPSTPATQGTELDVCDYTQELRVDTSSTQAVAGLSEADARDSVATGPLLVPGTFRTAETGSRRSAQSPRCHDPYNLSGNRRSGANTGKETGTDAHVAHVRPSGRYSATAPRGHQEETRREFGGEFHPREGGTPPRPLYSGDASDPPYYTSPGLRPRGQRYGPRTDLQHGGEGYAIDVPVPRQQARGEISQKRVPTMPGGSRHANEYAPPLLRTYAREDPSEISQLGQIGDGTDGRNDTGRSGIDVTAKQHDIGTWRCNPPFTWAALSGRRRKADLTLPLHIKPEAVATLNLKAVQDLDMSATTRKNLDHACRWLTWGVEYDLILEQLGGITRSHNSTIEGAPLQRLYEVRKVVDIEEKPLAYCNTFWREEEKPEGNRLRSIFEPLINDIIARDPRLHSTTQYTARDEIRRNVYRTEGGIQYDFSSWFDQISIAEAIRIFFGVKDHTALAVLAMGFRPSCEVAEAITEAISEVHHNDGMEVQRATCVDNILYTGGRAKTTTAATAFEQRASLCGAVLKELRPPFKTTYDFLGERYDHGAKTRCLTERTRLKCEFVAELCARKRSFTVRQIAAIIGVLLYAGNVLRICVGTYHYAVRYYAGIVASEPGYDTIVSPSKEVLVALTKWATRAAKNTPVDVYRDAELQLTIYVDASDIGWAAVSIGTTGAMAQIARNWTDAERAQWNVSSSVVAESVAIRNAVAVLVPNTMLKVRVFTDHLPIVWAAKRGFGRAFAYSWLMHCLAQYQTSFEILHVTGGMNPADELSRTRFGHQELTRFEGEKGAPSPMPAYLPVTSIGLGTTKRIMGDRWLGKAGFRT